MSWGVFWGDEGGGEAKIRICCSCAQRSIFASSQLAVLTCWFVCVSC